MKWLFKPYPVQYKWELSTVSNPEIYTAYETSQNWYIHTDV